jgi:uncharacterized protein (DUF433 family)
MDLNKVNPDQLQEYGEANALLRYTLEERFRHLTLLVAIYTGAGAAFFWQGTNIGLHIALALSGLFFTLLIWIMQWRAVWRMHILTHIVQEHEQEQGLNSKHLWGQLVSSRRPVWLGKVGDTEATTLLFFMGVIGWTFLATLSLYQLMASQLLPKSATIPWFIFVADALVALILATFMLKTLRNPARDLRSVPDSNQSQGQKPSSSVINDPNILAGQPVIEGTSIPVALVLKHFADTLSIQTILRDYPRLTLEDVKACLEYAQKLIEEGRVLEQTSQSKGKQEDRLVAPDGSHENFKNMPEKEIKHDANRAIEEFGQVNTGMTEVKEALEMKKPQGNP